MKYLSLFLFLIVSSIGFSQPSAVINSYNYLQSGELDKAKESADKAVAHDKTKSSAKAWKYRGDIYLQLYTTTNQDYRALSDNPLGVSFDSYLKMSELDTRGMYKSDMRRSSAYIQNMSLNKGVQSFNNKNYTLAADDFKLTVRIGEYRGLVDTLALFNIGLASERMGDIPTAIKAYKRCLDLGYQKEKLYNFILYQVSEDDESYLTTLNAGLSEYPNSQDLLTTKLNYHLQRGDFDVAMNYIDRAINNDPTNYVLYYAKGVLSENLGDKAKAIASYEKSLVLKPDYFDANYNLGASYFNSGVDIINAANDELDNAKHLQMKEQANVEFRMAMKYLEIALEIDPNNRNTMSSLKQIYARLELTDKYKVIDEKIKGN